MSSAPQRRRPSPRDPRGSPGVRAVAVAALAGSAVGVAETLAAALGPGFLSSAALAVHLAWAAVGWAALSAAVAGIVAALRRRGTGDAVGAAAAAAVVTAAAALSVVRSAPRHLALLVPACLALGAGAGLLVHRLARRWPALVRPRLLGAVHLALLTAVGGQVPAPFLAGAARVALVALAAAVAAAAAGAALLGPRLPRPAGTDGAPGRKLLSSRWTAGALALGHLGVLAIFALLVRQPAALAPPPSAGREDPLHLLLISIDTLRADRLGAYGHAAASTPALDALAAESVLFEQAISQVPLTGPSHATMLTGLYPASHGTLVNGQRLRGGVVTLADRLGEAGYRTAAVVAGFTLSHASAGLGRRFDEYDDDLSPWTWLPEPASRSRLYRVATVHGRTLGFPFHSVERRGAETTDRAAAWLERRGERPFFLFVHYFDPHRPYEPPPPWDRLHDPGYAGSAEGGWTTPEEEAAIRRSPRDAAHVRALYDGEISYVDAQVGRLLRRLAALGLAGRTLVVLTSDHGESLGEHDYWFDHSEALYEPSLRVPLMVRLPGGVGAGRRIAEPVELVDLAPTLLELLGLPASRGGEPGDAPALDGDSLVPRIAGGERPAARPAFAAIRSSRAYPGRSVLAVRHRGHKLLATSEWWYDHRRFPPERELYDLAADPGESIDLLAAGEPPPVLAELEALLAPWAARGGGAAPRRPDGPGERVREQLEALGYVEPGGERR